MKITVGIVTYKRARDVELCLKSILNQKKLPNEIIICDDSEDDETENIVSSLIKNFKEKSIEIIYIHKKGKSGQPKARNEIISKSNGDIIAFLDDDTECTEEWLSSIVQCYEDEKVGCVGGPSLLVNKNLDCIAPILRISNNMNKISEFGVVRDWSWRWVPPMRLETDLFRGANMSFRKNVLVEVGGFDTNYKGNAFREETDIMVRVKKLGYKLLYEPNAIVYHKAEDFGGCRIGNKNNWYWTGKNTIYFIKKNFKKNLYLNYLINIFDIKTLVEIFYFAIKNKNFTTFFIFKGYLDGIGGKV